MEPMMDTEEGEEAEGAELSSDSGYMIAIKVQGDGTMSVCKKPLPAETEKNASGYSPDGEEMPVNSFEEALKAAIKIHKANPVQADESKSFAAAYGAERMGGMMERPAKKGSGGYGAMA